MSRLDDLLHDYSDCHRDPLNKAIHWLCVPLIAFSTVGLLWTVPIPGLTAAWANLGVALLVGAMIYYLALSAAWALGMLAFCAAIAAACHLLAQWSVNGMRILCAILFIISWIAQLLGHRREGRKPAFFRDLQFLLIGPLWLLVALLRR
jgi:uncharacterized membrane protein YGL010W